MRIPMILVLVLTLVAISDASAQQQGHRLPGGLRTDKQPVSDSDFEWWCMNARHRFCPFPKYQSAAHFDWWCKHQKGAGRMSFRAREFAGCFSKKG